jgi:serine/threonine protein kinase
MIEATDDQLVSQLRGAMGLEEEASLRQRLQRETAGAYEVLDTLGSGAGGVVFKAHDEKLNRLVAIKCPWPSPPSEKRDGLAALFREARHLAVSSHPNIAAVHAISEKPDVPFIVMEFVDGAPITEALAGRAIGEQTEAFAHVLGAVEELHRCGLVHRDLKPGNILVDRHGVVKLVDFGIAQESTPGQFASRPEGTPAYLAPEQAAGEPTRPTADVFSLGVILFELLTGQRPFGGASESAVLAAVRLANPPLPRSLRDQIPGDLQAICLTALEKDPARRYPSAHEFLLDLERFSRGEVVWADPTLLTNVLDHGIAKHLGDIQRWKNDRVISARECDYFLERYSQLRQREGAWVLDSRRISFSQVVLHLGAWSCAVAAFLMLIFPWPRIGRARCELPAALFVSLLAGGIALWHRGTRRVGIVLLIGSGIIIPIAVAAILVTFGKFAGGNPADDLLPGIVTNQQLLIAALSTLVLGLALWRWTRTGAFSLITCLAAIAAVTAVLGLAGMRAELRGSQFDSLAVRYLGPAVALFLIAVVFDLRWKSPAFASPFYISGLTLLLASLTTIAWFGPTLHYLGFADPADDAALSRQIDYSFMINGGVYLIAGMFADRTGSSAWLRRIGAILFWLAPSHLLVPILHLENNWPIGVTGWTVPELLLPAAALAFVFASVPKQMKSFFFSGLFYTAIAVQRLTARHFEDRLAWPITLAVIGVAMSLLAWRRPALFGRSQKDLRC